jgi:aminopeptidase 2
VIDGLKALQRYIFSPKVEALGYEYYDSDDHLTALKRTLAINAAANGEDKNVIAQLQDRYKKYAAGDMNAFHPNLRSCLFSTVLKHTITPGADFDTIFKLYENGATADEKVGALGTIGAINDLSLSKKILNEIVLDSSKVKTQDSYIPIVSLAIHSPKRLEVLELIWEFITRNWTQLHDTLIPSLLGHVVKSGIQYCIGEEYATRTEKWAAGDNCQTEEEKELRKKQVKKVQRALDQGLESLRNSTRWYERDEQLVMQWLSVGGFQ